MIGAPDAVEAPAGLRSSAADLERARAAAFFARPKAQRAQEAFAFDDTLLDAADVRAALWGTCHRKCAYCETPLTEAGMLVDRFRPASGALDLTGELSADHYWWLALAWENLYPSCAECRSFKGARFPVREARAEPPATGDALAAERPLLLEPRRDDPEQHLVFAEDGTAASTTDEGRATIEILGLNRAQLLTDRAAAIVAVRAEWESVAAHPGAEAGLDPIAFDRLFDRNVPFAATRRQFLNTWAQRRKGELDAALGATPQGPSSVEEVAGDLPVVSKAERTRVKGTFDAEQRAQDDYSLAGNVNATEDYFRRTRRIERIEVRNFKVIGNVDLTPRTLASATAEAPWLMLLGENGCGKSSLLQATALALMGAEERKRLQLEASEYVRNGTRSGHVRVHLSGSPEPIELRFSRAGFRGADEPKLILLAYGATRLLPRGGERAAVDTSTARVENLFDPFSPIGNATDWLLGLDPPTFEAIARALKGLMGLENEDRLVRNRRAGRIDVEAFGARVPLEHLSDGYQSVVALATDMMISLLRQWPSVDAAEGTVLIDELGAHLHPRWRMRIVPSLREVSPGSSSSPRPTIRCASEGSATARSSSSSGTRRAMWSRSPTCRPLPVSASTSCSPRSTSVSTARSTPSWTRCSPSTTSSRRSRSGRRRTTTPEELSARLDGLDVLGTTRRERIVFEAADDYLAKAGDLADPEARLELKAATKRRISAIWEKAQAGEVPR